MQRDPEGMRIRILEAANQEFARNGLAARRVDRIAAAPAPTIACCITTSGHKETSTSRCSMRYERSAPKRRGRLGLSNPPKRSNG